MGILSWVGGDNRGEKGASKDVRPVLEQVEPRLLLSADLAGIEPVFAPDAPSSEHAIYIDLDQEQTDTLQSLPIITADPDRFPVTDLAIVSGQIEADDLGEEESLAEEAQPAQITCPVDDLVEAEEAISSSSSGQVTCVTQEECCNPDAGLKEETTGCLVGDQQETISTSETPSIEIRGPPQTDSGSLSSALEDCYSENESFVISAGDEGVVSPEEPIAPDLPGLYLIDPDPSNLQGQIIYLDFDGAEDVVYNGPVTVGPFDVPAFQAPDELAGQEEAIIEQVLVNLQEIFAGSGVIFTTEKPLDGAEYSTVYVGGDDSAFGEFGSFRGLAEQVDIGNCDKSDEALVFSSSAEEHIPKAIASHLTHLLAHEVGHLIGYQHDGSWLLAGHGVLPEDAEPSRLSNVAAITVVDSVKNAALDDFRFLVGDTQVKRDKLPSISNTYSATVTGSPDNVVFNLGDLSQNGTYDNGNWAATFDMSEVSDPCDLEISAYSGGTLIDNDSWSIPMATLPDWLFDNDTTFELEPIGQTWEDGYHFTDVTYHHFTKKIYTPESWVWSIPDLDGGEVEALNLANLATGIDVYSTWAMNSDPDGTVTSDHFVFNLKAQVLDDETTDEDDDDTVLLDESIEFGFADEIPIDKGVVSGKFTYDIGISPSFDNDLLFNGLSGYALLGAEIGTEISLGQIRLPLLSIPGIADVVGEAKAGIGFDWSFAIYPTLTDGGFGLAKLTSTANISTSITGSLELEVGLGLASGGGSITGLLEQALSGTYSSGSNDIVYSAPGSLTITGQAYYDTLWGFGPSGSADLFEWNIAEWDFLPDQPQEPPEPTSQKGWDGDPELVTGAMTVTVSTDKTEYNTGMPITVSGTAYYGGTPAASGTVDIELDGNVWTAAVETDGTYERVISAPEVPNNYTITAEVRNGLGGTASDTKDITVETVADTTVTPGYPLTADSYWEKAVPGGTDIVPRDRDGNDITNPPDDTEPTDYYENRFSPETANGMVPILRIENADGFPNDTYFKCEIYDPSGDPWDTVKWYDNQGNEWYAGQGWEWAYVWIHWLDNNDNVIEFPLWDKTGVWTLDWFIDDDGDDRRDDYKKIASHEINWRYDFTEHVMARGVKSESEEWMYDQATNVFYTDDTRAYTWMNLDNISEDIYVKWEWYEPNGDLYLTYPNDLPPYEELRVSELPESEFDPADLPYDWARAWGWMGILGEGAAQRCGHWRVDVSVKDPEGEWDLQYIDYFQILERPAEVPEISVELLPAEPEPGDSVHVDISVTDNTYLNSVQLYVNDPANSLASWDDLVVGSMSRTVNLGTFSAGETVEYWVVARDTSGNVTVTPRHSFRVLATPVASVEVSDIGVFEGDSGTTNALFGVSVSYDNPTAQPVAVEYNYRTIDGTAYALDEYMPVDGSDSLTVPAGESGTASFTVPVAIIGDMDGGEPDRNFFLEVTVRLDGTLTATDIGECWILDDDPQSYMLTDYWGGSESDADKDGTPDPDGTPPGTGDDYMCWAATASNMLDWTAWGNTSAVDGTADDIFQYYQNCWTDDYGRPLYALRWWFDGDNDQQGQSGWADVDVDGGSFYPGVSHDLYVSLNDYEDDGRYEYALSDIASYFEDPNAVAVRLDYGDGHWLTCWGYDYHAADPDYYVGIWLTDSDDGSDGLNRYGIDLVSGIWELTDGPYSGSHITHLDALRQKPEGMVEVAPAPDNVAASQDLADRIVVTWDTAPRAASYQVYRNTGDDFGSASLLDPDVSSLQYDDTSAAVGVTYCYWVKASNTGGTSGESYPATGLRPARIPEIEIRGNSIVIANGDTTADVNDHTDFGLVNVTSGWAPRTFAVYNTGTGALSLTGSPRVSLSNNTDFSIQIEPSTPVPVGDSTTFEIWFDPGSDGVKTATVSIANDDADDNPYTFMIQGTGLTIPEVIYVDDDASAGNENGLSWDNAFVNLQDALALARVTGANVQEIRVAQGVYWPDQGSSIILGDREATFQLVDSVSLIGGYAGLGEADPDARDITLYETILSGDLSGDDGADFANYGDNSYCVVKDAPDVVLDGFTVRGGNSGGGTPEGSEAGGMVIDYSTTRVANCTFEENRGWNGGGLTNNAAATIVDCVFSNNWAGQYGAGVCNYGSLASAQFTGCAFSDNDAAMAGGGMYSWSCSPTLADCTFSRNTAVSGAGMYNSTCSITLSACTFDDNSAEGGSGYCYGGGIFNGDSTGGSVSGCTFSGNSAYMGGGIYDDGALSLQQVSDCSFVGNEAVFGGGMCVRSTTSYEVTNNIFSNNRADYGGGIWIQSASPEIVNCAFVGGSPLGVRESGGGGGGICNESASPEIVNCTVAGNNAHRYGGGMWNYAGSSPVVVNSIFWGNTASESGNEIYNGSSDSLTIDYCCISGGIEGIVTAAGGVVNDGGHNGSDDPLFVRNPDDGGDGWGDDLATPAIDEGTNDDLGDLRLSPDSPCIDAGDNDAVPSGVTVDLDGGPRFAGDAVDMGAYECHVSRVIYVDDDAPLDPGAQDTSVSDEDEDGTFEHPYDAIQEAIVAAADGDTVIVLAGTYTGEGNFNIDLLGKTITVRSESGAATCTIDCGSNGRGFEIASGEGAATVLSGFTITNGMASTESWQLPGGGTVTYSAGGAIYCDGFAGTICDCIISYCHAGKYGGGIFAVNSSGMTISGTTFLQNESADDAGAMAIHHGSVNVDRCVFDFNSARYGGAVACNGSSSTVSNCLFSDNDGAVVGGGIMIHESTDTLVNCTFYGNSAGTGGAAAVLSNSSAQIVNSILWEDTAGNGPEVAVYNSGPSSATISYSDVQGGEAEVYVETVHGNTCTWGEGNENVEPHFADASNDDYHLRFYSPCVDAGTNDAIPAGITMDLGANPRLAGLSVDMGAYEGAVNVALEQPARQSSTYDGRGAELAVDGDTNGDWYDDSVQCTDWEAEPWWEVDLGGQYTIEAIEIWNRTGSVASKSRLSAFYVLVSDTPLDSATPLAELRTQAGIWSHYVDGYPDPQTLLSVGRTGRYVRIQLTGTTHLHMAEVKVFGTAYLPSGSNVAREKPARQSSTYDDRGAELAVDGDMNGDWSADSLQCTDWEAQPWWEVDLEGLYTIEAIEIWNRTGSVASKSRLGAFYVLVSDTPFGSETPLAELVAQAGIWSHYVDGYPDPETLLSVGRTGRYVRIQLTGTTHLHLAEVKVFGTAYLPSGSNVALEKSARQSSTYDGREAYYGVDGDTNGEWYAGSLQCTDWESEPWWEVDLEGLYEIEAIEIWNRTGSVASRSRLSAFYVLVSDTPFGSATPLAELRTQTGVWSYYVDGYPDPQILLGVGCTGRYIRIQLTEETHLHMAEVKVFGTAYTPSGSNVALGRSARQSSTYDGRGPELAVDEDTNGDWNDGSLQCTDWESEPWWEVDLEGLYTIEAIEIWNRTGSVASKSRLGAFYVLVSDTPFGSDTPLAELVAQAGIWSHYVDGYPDPETLLSVGRMGRYVRIQLTGMAHLHMAEVKVFGTAYTPSGSNLALEQSARQSSTYAGRGAELAVDGDTNGDWYAGSVQCTDWEAQPWWEVDLEGLYEIEAIEIWNRTGSVASKSRLSAFYVLVSETPFGSETPLAELRTQAEVWSYYVDGYPDPQILLGVGCTGRYIRIQLTEETHLHMAEVKVFGTA